METNHQPQRAPDLLAPRIQPAPVFAVFNTGPPMRGQEELKRELCAAGQLRQTFCKFTARSLAVACANLGFLPPPSRGEMTELLIRYIVSALFYPGVQRYHAMELFLRRLIPAVRFPPLLECICAGRPPTGDLSLLECTRCRSRQHAVCMGKNRTMKPYMCPTCLIARLDPLMPVDLANPGAVSLKPFLLQTVVAKRLQPCFPAEHTIPFIVYDAPGCVIVQNTRAFVRCIRLDGESSEHMWPFYGQLQLNSNQNVIFELPAHNHNKRYNDTPYSVPLPHPPAPQLNILSLQRVDCRDFEVTAPMKADAEYQYVAAVVLATELTPSVLVSRTVAQRSPPVSESRRKFMEKLKQQYDSMGGEDDCVCQEKKVRLSLDDPYLPGKLIRTPCCGTECPHLQSFDLDSYVVMNQRVKYWRCPICSKKALEFVIDTHLQLLLRVLGENRIVCHEVKVSRHGNFIVKHKWRLLYVGENGGTFVLRPRLHKHKAKVVTKIPAAVSVPAPAKKDLQVLLPCPLLKLEQEEAKKPSSSPQLQEAEPDVIIIDDDTPPAAPVVVPVHVPKSVSVNASWRPFVIQRKVPEEMLSVSAQIPETVDSARCKTLMGEMAAALALRIAPAQFQQSSATTASSGESTPFVGKGFPGWVPLDVCCSLAQLAAANKEGRDEKGKASEL